MSFVIFPFVRGKVGIMAMVGTIDVFVFGKIR